MNISQRTHYRHLAEICTTIASLAQKVDFYYQRPPEGGEDQENMVRGLAKDCREKAKLYRAIAEGKLDAEAEDLAENDPQKGGASNDHDSNSEEKASMHAAMRERLREAVQLSTQLGKTRFFLPLAAEILNGVLRDKNLENLCITPQNINTVIQDLAFLIEVDAQQQADEDEEGN